MSEGADEVEAWLSTYLDLREVIPVAQHITWGSGSPAVAVVIAVWADGWDLTISRDSFGAEHGPPVFPTATDDLGGEYTLVGGSGNGASDQRPRTFESWSWTPTLNPRATRIDFANSLEGHTESLCTIALHRPAT